jgi:hypothetical protein
LTLENKGAATAELKRAILPNLETLFVALNIEEVQEEFGDWDGMTQEEEKTAPAAVAHAEVITALAEASLPRLKTLGFEQTIFTGESAAILANKFLPRLTTVYFDRCLFPCKAWKGLVRGKTMWRQLETFMTFDTMLSYGMLFQMRCFVAAGHKCANLKHLIVKAGGGRATGFAARDEAGAALAKAIRSGLWPQLETLMCSMRSKGEHLLAEAALEAKPWPKLKNLISFDRKQTRPSEALLDAFPSATVDWKDRSYALVCWGPLVV